MEVKNGIIIDGVLHELKDSKREGCKGCSLYDLCKRDFVPSCLCWIMLDSETIKDKESLMFFKRGKVKIVKDEAK